MIKIENLNGLSNISIVKERYCYGIVEFWIYYLGCIKRGKNKKINK